MLILVALPPKQILKALAEPGQIFRFVGDRLLASLQPLQKLCSCGHWPLPFPFTPAQTLCHYITQFCWTEFLLLRIALPAKRCYNLSIEVNNEQKSTYTHRRI